MVVDGWWMVKDMDGVWWIVVVMIVDGGIWDNGVKMVD